MPQSMEPEAAARVVIDALAERPETVVHPLTLGVGARALGLLPGWTRGALFRAIERVAKRR